MMVAVEGEADGWVVKMMHQADLIFNRSSGIETLPGDLERQREWRKVEEVEGTTYG